MPTLSQWGLISLIVILGIVGFIFYRRRATA
ncbi:MAG: IPTL-CTERM sorting domain-containing protein [Candidatus Dadabacteria bacterium]|nr:IPTL-CTERM sorting domain-containing protein [Candidatus Dadabacteria bacterium]